MNHSPASKARQAHDQFVGARDRHLTTLIEEYENQTGGKIPRVGAARDWFNAGVDAGEIATVRALQDLGVIPKTQDTT